MLFYCGSYLNVDLSKINIIIKVYSVLDLAIFLMVYNL